MDYRWRESARGPSRVGASMLLLGGLAAGGGLLPAQEAEVHLAAGDSAHVRFESLVALEHYRAALERDPDNPEARWKAAREAADAGEAEPDSRERARLYAESETHAREAVALQPDGADAHFALARALGLRAMASGIRERVTFATAVRESALSALSLEADHSGALHVMGEWNAAVMRLSRVERFIARSLLGGRALAEASWEDALRYLERAVEVDPERLTHRLALGRIYLDVGQRERARQLFRSVVEGRRTSANDPLYQREAAAELARLGG